MFIVTKSEFFNTVGVVETPTGKGKTSKYSFDIKLLQKSPIELDELREKNIDEGAPLLEILTNNVELFSNIVVDWGGIQDSEGNDIPFSKENLMNIVLKSRHGLAFSKAIWRAINEMVGVVEKN